MMYIHVLNRGPAVYDSSATGDFSLETSKGEASPTFVPRGVCQTPLRDFMKSLSANQNLSPAQRLDLLLRGINGNERNIEA